MKEKNKKQETTLSSIGLDFDDKSIKLVKIINSSQGIFIDNYAIFNFKKTPSSTNDISTAIKNLFTQLKLDDKEVHTALSGLSVSVRRIKVPELPDNELRSAIKWEAKNLIPFPIDTLIIDYRIIGKSTEKGANKLDVLLVAIQNEALQKHMRIIENTGLKVASVSIIPFTLWDLIKMDTSQKVNDVIAVIDIGAEVSSINIFKNSILQFTREISIGGNSITKAMTGSLVSDQWQATLTYEQAEAIKQKYGIPDEHSDGATTEEGVPLSQLFDILKPTLRRLSNEIQRSLEFYKEHFLEEKVNKIIISGGSSQLINLDKYLQNNLGIAVEVVNPLKNIKVLPTSQIDDEKLKALAPRLAVAIALSLSQAEGLNLIASRSKAKKEEEKKSGKSLFSSFNEIKLSGASFFIGLGVIIALAVIFYIYLIKTKEKLAYEVQRKEYILSDLKRLIERKEVIEKISKQETKVRNVLGHFNALIPNGIILTQLAYGNDELRVTVSGVSTNINKIGNILTNVESSPYFSQAKLIGTKRIPKAEEYPMSFTIEFKVDNK